MKKILSILFLVSMLCSLLICPVNAVQQSSLGTLVNAGHDKGYSQKNPIDSKDVHFGWELGTFYISGYSRDIDENTDTPIYLKNVGDTVKLSFDLKQDINCLNGDKKLSISGDDNGYDEYFGIKKYDYDLGKGTLIIRHVDYQDNATIQVYTNYLAADGMANTDIELYEEGDYEVALNYEVKNEKVWLSLKNRFPNYRIYFKISIRNGNCMVYPLDVENDRELMNTSITENGFYLDLAKSRYLDIDIKKEVLVQGANGLTEDTRFNKPAKDGERYTEEGVYTITASNRYTGQQTVKKIYVGKDSILKAHVTTGLSISEIKQCLADGAVINSDGTITMPNAKPEQTETEQTENSTSTNDSKDNPQAESPNQQSQLFFYITVWGLILLGIMVCLTILVCNKNKRFDNNKGE